MRRDLYEPDHEAFREVVVAHHERATLRVGDVFVDVLRSRL